MDHSKMDHAAMSHVMVSNSTMEHTTVNHQAMGHTTMNHSAMNHNMNDMGMGTDGEMNHGSMMKMYFHFSENSEILFKFWNTSSIGGIIGACIFIFIIAMLYEGLKVLREVMLHNFRKSNDYKVGERLTPECRGEANTPGNVYVIDGSTDSSLTFKKSLLNSHHLMQTGLHMVQITISYALMLIFMTYNVWLCIAIVLGAGSGYFLFGWRRLMIIDANEHCH